MRSIYTNEQWIGLGSGAAAAAAETYEKLGLEKLVAQGREKVEKGPLDTSCNPMRLRLQPYAPQPATLVCLSLQPRVPQVEKGSLDFSAAVEAARASAAEVKLAPALTLTLTLALTLTRTLALALT